MIRSYFINAQFLIKRFLFSSMVGLLLPANLFGQPFTKIVIDDSVTFAGGVSWIDYDHDNDLDLYVTNMIQSDSNLTRDRLFRNDGNDTFVKITGEDITDLKNHTRGVSWADYNNDGYTDVYLTNRNFLLNTSRGSLLYKNEGNGLLSRIMDGDIGGNNTISGIGSAWADYNNDGFVDLFIATTKSLAYPTDTLSNVLFDNNGDGTFTRNVSSVVVNGDFDYYTMPTWSDYDLDGDPDLFITAGPVQSGVLQPDYFYRNLLIENGTATFERDLTGNYATQPRDGQEIQWIDYDNDGDLDLYVTNYGGTPGTAAGMANDFYRNNNGTYTKITTGSIATDADITLGQVWGDFDNDGDLDLYTCNQTSANHFAGGHRYYQNDGPPDYTFTKITSGDFVATNRIGWGTSAGDYDNDGDLDLYVTINTAFNQPDFDALYRNDLNNGNNWVNITCIGMKTGPASSGANRSAIGAKVHAKATISGNAIWQMREISGNHGFNGQNSLRVHFGLGDAAVIDSLIIRWPGSSAYIFTDVVVNQFYRAIEGHDLEPVTAIVPNESPKILPSQVELYQNYPNPFNPSTTIGYKLSKTSQAVLKIYTIAGEEIRTLVSAIESSGYYKFNWDGTDNFGQPAASGIYIYQIKAGSFSQSRKMLLVR